MAVPVAEAARKLNEIGRPVILLGDGVPVYEEEIRKALQVPFLFAPPHLNRQRASSVAVCAMEYVRQGENGDRGHASAGLSSGIPGGAGAGKKTEAGGKEPGDGRMKTGMASDIFSDHLKISPMKEEDLDWGS